MLLLCSLITSVNHCGTLGWGWPGGFPLFFLRGDVSDIPRVCNTAPHFPLSFLHGSLLVWRGGLGGATLAADGVLRGSEATPAPTRASGQSGEAQPHHAVAFVSAHPVPR